VLALLLNAQHRPLPKAFPRFRRFDKALLHFDAALWATLKRHQSAVNVNSDEVTFVPKTNLNI
jgi:hypothetical protein